VLVVIVVIASNVVCLLVLVIGASCVGVSSGEGGVGSGLMAVFCLVGFWVMAVVVLALDW